VVGLRLHSALCPIWHTLRVQLHSGGMETQMKMWLERHMYIFIFTFAYKQWLNEGKRPVKKQMNDLTLNIECMNGFAQKERPIKEAGIMLIFHVTISKVILCVHACFHTVSILDPFSKVVAKSLVETRNLFTILQNCWIVCQKNLQEPFVTFDTREERILYVVHQHIIAFYNLIKLLYEFHYLSPFLWILMGCYFTYRNNLEPRISLYYY